MRFHVWIISVTCLVGGVGQDDGRQVGFSRDGQAMLGTLCASEHFATVLQGRELHVSSVLYLPAPIRVFSACSAYL